MRRTELIPQTTAAINKGKVWYHFSMMRKDTNAPSTNREHQINFFESHFTEMKYGWISGESGTSNPNLQFMISQQSKWKTEWKAGVWHNVAYEIVSITYISFLSFSPLPFPLALFLSFILLLLCSSFLSCSYCWIIHQTDQHGARPQDFSANTVGFWHSEGAAPLTQVVKPASASTSSNGADWHLGVLELPRSGYNDATEDFYFSGVYIESGSITTAVGGPA